MKKKDNSYFTEREKKHIKNRIKSDLEFNKKLEEEYKKTTIEIKNEIQIAIERFADKENISIIEARKRIDKNDIEEFVEKVKEYVFNCDFTQRANEELRLYNVTMRTNRLKLLQKRIELDLMALAQKEEELLRERLEHEIDAEIERQVGILNMTVPQEKALRKLAKTYIDADFYSATFSDRIWYNNKELITLIERGIERSILRGENPRKWAKSLIKTIKNGMSKGLYNAERLAVTEVGRVQIKVQEESFKSSGYEEYIYICEPGACHLCLPLHETVHKVKDMVQGENAPMMHPWCRCSVAAYYEEE